MSTIHDVMRRAEEARQRADRFDAARDELEADEVLLARLADRWWEELEGDRLRGVETRIVMCARMSSYDHWDSGPLVSFVRETEFLMSSECQTMIEDRADGENWPT